MAAAHSTATVGDLMELTGDSLSRVLDIEAGRVRETEDATWPELVEDRFAVSGDDLAIVTPTAEFTFDELAGR
ncbi:hypothetical protein KC221_29980, partial [Mycobacterium tuberculosis]|nr:hypothetical protein [Mycobacterium tuberculosis]